MAKNAAGRVQFMEMAKIPIHASFMWSERKSEYITLPQGGKAPEDTIYHTSTQIDNLLYIFGGTKGEIDPTTRKQKSYNSLYIYDMATMKFHAPTVVGQIPEGRHRHSAVLSDSGDIYIFGGVNGGKNVYRLKTKSDPLCWELVPTTGNGPDHRYAHLSCIYKNKLFIIGGKEKEKKCCREIYVLDLVSGAWRNQHYHKDIPSDTSHFSAHQVGSCLYFIGAETRDIFSHITYLELETVSWEETRATGTPPARIASCGSTLYETNKILVYGGISTNETPSNKVHLLEVISPDVLHWLDIQCHGKVPAARYGHSVNTYGTSLFIFGGQTSSAITNEMNILVHQVWESQEADVKDGPGARIGAACVVVNEKVYIIGGAKGQATYQVFVWNTITRQWESLRMSGIPPRALVGHCCAAVGSEIFIYGGGDGENPVNDLYVIDTVNLKWTKPETEGTKPEGAIGCTMVSYGYKIIVYGGFGDKKYSGDVAELETSTMTWNHPMQRGDPLPPPRVGHTAVLIDKTEMFVFGGSHDGRPLRDTWCLNVKSMYWDKFTNQGEVPDPRFGHTAVAVGRSMYIFGGCGKNQDSRLPASDGDLSDYRRCTTNHLYTMEPTRHGSLALWNRPVIGGKAPEERYRHVMFTFNGNIVVTTGSKGGGTLWLMDTGFFDETTAQPDSPRERVKQTNQEAKPDQSVQYFDSDPQIQLVLKFLHDLNLHKYGRIFLKQEVDWKTLLRCSDRDLIEIGVTALGPRKKILKQLSKFNATDLIDPESIVKAGGTKEKPYLFQQRYIIDANYYNEIKNNPVKEDSNIVYATDLKTKKSVIIKFIKNQIAYEKEIRFLKDLRGNTQLVVELLDYEDRELKKKLKQEKKKKFVPAAASVVEPPLLKALESYAEISPPLLNITDDPTSKPELENAEISATAKPTTNTPTLEGSLWETYQPYPYSALHWIVLERGKMTLREYFKECGTMYESQRKAIFERILLIFEHVHSCGIVHLDAKPENFVFFGDEMRLKLIDFASSSYENELVSPISTPSYCSPEMAKAWIASETDSTHQIAVTTACDIWAFGLMFFESYTGYPIFEGPEKPYKTLSGNEEWLNKLPWGLVDNRQAQNLLKKILVTKARKRPSAEKLLKSVYFTWGLDSNEIEATFGPLQAKCDELTEQIEVVTKDASFFKNH
eukprot:c21171_g1_i1.p1 GENE.c21171_g1_i1~~c21171_g1_i1.p1  ORF type:complete len:1188 (-),score=503.42 c21171_g1_i1:31-3543(-)